MRVEMGTLSVDRQMPNWNLDDEDAGTCSCTYRADFETEFDERPAVTVSLSGVDLVGADSRVALASEVTEVATGGFEVKVTTHRAQQIQRAVLSWIAVGR